MVQYSLSLSHAGQACANVRTHMHILRSRYASLGTCDVLVRRLGSRANIRVNQHKSKSMCTRAAEGVILSLTLTRRGRMHKCAHAYEHIQRYVL